jgi:type VI secretion system protein ImpL
VLAGQVRALLGSFKPAGVPDVLNGARELPGYSGLDIDNPPGSFLYGLYTVPPVLRVTGETYASCRTTPCCRPSCSAWRPCWRRA